MKEEMNYWWKQKCKSNDNCHKDNLDNHHQNTQLNFVDIINKITTTLICHICFLDIMG